MVEWSGIGAMKLSVGMNEEGRKMGKSMEEEKQKSDLR